MWENIKGIFAGLKKFYQELEPQKRRVILVSVTVGVMVIVGLLYLINRTSYSVLYSGLDPQDAGVIVEKLKADKVSYRLGNGGTTILVPSGKVYDLRLELANQGIPQIGSVGYEIFDKNNLGTTDFVQRINYRRALEGELARTIATLTEIKSARVHLVIPERALFSEDQKPTTASIVLKLKTGAQLSPRQIRGISHLVAASVEGLQPEDVTIVDSNGNIMSQNQKSSSIAGLTHEQLEMRKSVENYFAEKVQSLLENVIGPNKAVVRVAVELDFDRVEKTIEQFDPDNTSVRSEERNVETNTSSGDNKVSRTENVITNYEINRTVQHIVGDVGTIKRITTAVLIDGNYETVTDAKGKEIKKYIPRSAEEISQLTNIVKSAVGFDPRRNDEIEVVNIPFDRTHIEEQEKYLNKFEKQLFLEKVLHKVLYGFLLIVLFLVLRKLFKKFKPLFSYTANILPPGTENFPAAVPADAQRRIMMQQKVSRLTKEQPEDTAKLLKAWLVEEENE